MELKINVKKELENCFNLNKEILFDLSFNTSYLFYEEPQNFQDYLDLIDGLKESTLSRIIKNFNN
jgi:hypothetical protein